MSDLEESCQDPDLEVSGPLHQFFNSDSVASLIDLNTLMSYIESVCLNDTPFSSEARMPANKDLKLQAVTDRTSGGCLFTIPEFKSWTTRTGVDILKVHNISYRKFPGGWRHEFLEVSLEPDFTFASPATAATVVESSGHPFYYDVTRNVRSGLRFRIDRGQRKAELSDPPSTRAVGHRFAKDMVELIDNNEELDSKSEVVFTLGRHFVGGVGDEFLQARVFDIIFVLERALETFGPDYALHSRNCWTFASFIIQSITLLFHGYHDPSPSSLVIEGGLVRRWFPGRRVARNIYELNEQSDLFTADALLGIKKDEGLPISRNPFRVLLIRSICFCIVSIISNTSGKLDPNMASCAAGLQTLRHSVLASELITSGMVSLLAAIVAQHLDKCTPACSKTDFEASHRAAIASGVIVGLFPILCIGDNFGITPLHLQCCCRFALQHQSFLYSNKGIRSLLLAAVCAGLPSATDHVIEAFAKGIVTGDGLKFCAHVLRNKPSDKECICIANVFKSVCDAAAHLGKSEMLGEVAKAWFVSLWPKSTKIFLDVTSLISSSDAMMKLLVEAGILKDFIAILRKSSQAISRLTSSKSDLIIHCASTIGILICAINVASRIHSELYLEQVISAAIDYLDIWKKHWMPLLHRTPDLLGSLKEASDFQMKSSYDAILKGALPQATSMMWDVLNKMMRLSGFHMIAALGTLLRSLVDPPSPGTHGPSGSSQPHPHSLELNQDLQKALDWRWLEKDMLAKMHHEKKWKRKPVSGRKYY